MFNLSMMYLKFRIILYFIKINLSSAMTIGAYFIYSISLNSYNNYEIGIILFYRGGNRLRNKISHNRRWWNLNLNQVCLENYPVNYFKGNNLGIIYNILL